MQSVSHSIIAMDIGQTPDRVLFDFFAGIFLSFNFEFEILEIWVWIF